MQQFTVIDISGDIGITAYGRTKQETFVHAALGMYSLITNPDKIQERRVVHVSVQSHSPDSLLVSWLNELIFHFDAYGFIGKKITLHAFINGAEDPDNPQACSLEADISGEEFDPGCHEGKLLIKAATYHKLRIEKMDEAWEIDVIFDI
jgi:SHS2 domain-containing protein